MKNILEKSFGLNCSQIDYVQQFADKHMMQFDPTDTDLVSSLRAFALKRARLFQDIEADYCFGLLRPKITSISYIMNIGNSDVPVVFNINPN